MAACVFMCRCLCVREREREREGRNRRDMSGMDSQVRRDVKTVDCCVQVISSFARHYKTGEPLADSVVHDMCAAKHLFAASISLFSLYVESALSVCVLPNTSLLHL